MTTTCTRATFPAAATSECGPLRQAATACFGTGTWPEDRVVPQAWGQTIARLLSDDGVIVGISFVPDFHG